MRTGLVLAMLMMGTAASGEVLPGAAAASLLFGEDGAEVALRAEAGLPEDQAAALSSVGGAQPYYGAIAISPEEGLMSEATVAAANHHTIAAAEAAALAACDAKKTGAAPCIIAAQIRPIGWEARPLTLSADATAGMDRDYPDESGVLAISPATGAWSIAEGADAEATALAACNVKAAILADCEVAVRD